MFFGDVFILESSRSNADQEHPRAAAGSNDARRTRCQPCSRHLVRGEQCVTAVVDTDLDLLVLLLTSADG